MNLLHRPKSVNQFHSIEMYEGLELKPVVIFIVDARALRNRTGLRDPLRSPPVPLISDARCMRCVVYDSEQYTYDRPDAFAAMTNSRSVHPGFPNHIFATISSFA